MKSVKEVLNQYEEKPSADVWERLNARLDEEMPLTGKVHRIHRLKALKWTAAVLLGLIVGGAVVLGVFLHQRGNQGAIVENNNTKVVETKEEISDAVAEPIEKVETEVAATAIEADHAAPTQITLDNMTEKSDIQPKTEEKVVKPNSNARQIVLPPNSTLAKQLAADPVLKKLSDDSVDWSLPVHFSIPNLFTPNNDGVNDFFVIEGLENYSSPKLVVRDKNNNVVYQSETYKNTWDGGACADGVYSYEFTFLYNGIENQATGKVRIMRN